MSWGRFFYADGPYKGKIIDMDTKRPIKGAAVLAVWSEAEFDLVHGQVNFYEAKETLTDEEGNFSIPILWMVSVNPLSVIQLPLFYMFKPGYAAYGGWSIDPVDLGENIRVKKRWGRTIVELRRLTTREERLRNMHIYPGPHVPRGKYPNMKRLENMERANLGLR